MNGSVFIVALHGRDDIKSTTIKKWTDCDVCKRTMHINCVPKSHKESISYDSEDSSEEVAFTCEFCLCE